MNHKSALAAGVALGVLTACTPAQIETAISYQEKIARACSVAMTLAPFSGPVAPWIVGGCGAERMIAQLALDPSSLAWVQELIAKARGRA